MSAACCFHQRTYVAQGHMNGAPNETRIHSSKFVRISFVAPFIWPCVSYVLWRKQNAANIHVCKNEINNCWKNTNLLVDICIFKYIYIYIYIRKTSFSNVSKIRSSISNVCKDMPNCLGNSTISLQVKYWLILIYLGSRPEQGIKLTSNGLKDWFWKHYSAVGAR